MKKNLVLGTLIAATVLQSATPAWADKQDLGQIVGGIIGGLAGSKIGKGNGNTAAIIAGTIVGSLVGSNVGQSMDNADRQALGEAQRRCFQGPVGQGYDWNGQNYGSRTGVRGNFVSMREGRHMRTQEVCREYRSEIYAGGRSEVHTGIACTRRDGSYYEVNTTEVSFGGGYGGPNHPGYGGGGYAGGVRPIPPPPRGGGMPDRRDFRSQVVLSADNFGRRGAQWYRIYVNRPSKLSEIRLSGLSGQARILDAVVHTDRGQSMNVRELTGYVSGRSALYAGRLPFERIQGIDVLVEAQGHRADVEVIVSSQEGPVSLSVQRY